MFYRVIKSVERFTGETGGTGLQTAELTDEEMIARIQQGEPGLLELLIDRYYDDIYYFCRSKIGDSEAAYDCAQETFLKLTRYISGYREQQKFKGYLFSIARNVCHDYFRGKPPDMAGEEVLETLAAGDVFSGKEDAYLLERALAFLSEGQRETVMLRFYYGFKVREIARITGVPLAAAKSRLRRGLQKLKEIMEKEEMFCDR